MAMTRAKRMQGYVPWGPLASDQALRGQLQQSLIFDELMVEGGPRTIGICSCQGGAGTTSVALGLALMLYERTAEPIALVEANLRTPHLGSTLKIPEGNCSFEAFANGHCAIPEDLPNIPDSKVALVAGYESEVPLPLLNNAKSRLKDLEAYYRYTVIDFPPILSFPDLGIAGPGVDGVYLVLEAEDTRWQVAREAKKRLESANITLLGVILNKKPHYIPRWVYRLL